ncbi:MAG: hypothetical protein D9V44_07225 [Actinobacteria bacterium]|nr:MAG: hypothetical protein D9V44_07225 [Actinomycetota bacterium]
MSGALEGAGIAATLSGGGAVSIYTDNEYQSCDLDFITSQRNDVIAKALEPLGFCYQPGKRELEHPDTDYYVEFPSGPLSFGSTLVVSQQDATTVGTRYGPIKIVTPTQSAMDRLTHYFAWGDRQALDQVVMIARRHPLDWGELNRWIIQEGADVGVMETVRKRAGLA